MTDDSEQKLNQILVSFLADLTGSLDQSLAFVVESQTDKLEQILASLQEILARLPGPPDPKQGCPALYMCSDYHSLFVKKQQGGQLTRIPIPESLYELFRLVIEFLQADMNTVHWVWGFILWDQWRKYGTKNPSRAFSIQSARLRGVVEDNWGLGTFLGKGGGRNHFTIPVEATKHLFSTTELPEQLRKGPNGEPVFAYPIWELFMRDEVAKIACKNENWQEAIQKASGVLEIDPDNWLANRMVIEIARQPNLPANQSQAILKSPAVQRACQFAARNLTSYEQATKTINAHAPDPSKQGEREAFNTAFLGVKARLDWLSKAIRWCQEMQQTAPPRHGASAKATATPAAPMPPDPCQSASPWRTREQCKTWLGEPACHPEITRIQNWIIQRIDKNEEGQRRVDAKNAFLDYVRNLACDQSWRLPQNGESFKWWAWEYVKIQVFHVPGRDYREQVKNSKDIAKLLKAATALDANLAAPLSPQQKQELREMCGGWSLEKLNTLLALVRASSFTMSDMDRFAATSNADTESEGDEDEAGGPVDDGDNLGRDDERDDPNDEDKRQ